MSLQAITAALAYRGLSSSEKLILIGWANYADEAFRCYPSQRRLSDDTGLSDRQIRRLALSLEERGLIQREERRRADGSRSSDLITLVCLQADTMSGGVRTPCPGGADTMSGQNLSLNHSGSKEPSSNSPRAKKGCRLPPDWKPSDADLTFAANQNMTAEETKHEADQFRDFWISKPGAGGCKLDWSATWRTWCRNRRGAGQARKPISSGDRSKVAAKPQSRMMFPPEGGFYRRTTGFQVSGLTPENRETARQAVQSAMTRPPLDKCEEWVAGLHAVTARRGDDTATLDLTMSLYAACLAKYPADVAKQACLHFAMRSAKPNWFPTLSELAEWCEREAAQRQQLLDSLQK